MMRALLRTPAAVAAMTWRLCRTKELRHAADRIAARPRPRPRLQSAGPGAYRRVLARRELPIRRADLPAGQPAAARAAAGRARQAAPARALGDDARTEVPVHEHEPGHLQPRP